MSAQSLAVAALAVGALLAVLAAGAPNPIGSPGQFLFASCNTSQSLYGPAGHGVAYDSCGRCGALVADAYPPRFSGAGAEPFVTGAISTPSSGHNRWNDTAFARFVPLAEYASVATQPHVVRGVMLWPHAIRSSYAGQRITVGVFGANIDPMSGRAVPSAAMYASHSVDLATLEAMAAAGGGVGADYLRIYLNADEQRPLPQQVGYFVGFSIPSDAPYGSVGDFVVRTSARNETAGGWVRIANGAWNTYEDVDVHNVPWSLHAHAIVGGCGPCDANMTDPAWTGLMADVCGVCSGNGTTCAPGGPLVPNVKCAHRYTNGTCAACWGYENQGAAGRIGVDTPGNTMVPSNGRGEAPPSQFAHGIVAMTHCAQWNCSDPATPTQAWHLGVGHRIVTAEVADPGDPRQVCPVDCEGRPFGTKVVNACGVCTATPDVTQNPDGSCVGTCTLRTITGCVTGCYPPSVVAPTTDLCGSRTGGCSGLPVNECVECNPDGGNATNVAAATRRGYYQCAHNATLPSPCGCVVIPPDVLGCANETVDYSVWESNAVRRNLWYSGTGTSLTSNVSLNFAGASWGMPNGYNVFGIAQEVVPPIVPVFPVNATELGKYYIGGISMGVDYWAFNGTDYPITFSLQTSTDGGDPSGVPLNALTFNLSRIADHLVGCSNKSAPYPSNCRLEFKFDSLVEIDTPMLSDGTTVLNVVAQTPFFNYAPAQRYQFPANWSQIWFRTAAIPQARFGNYALFNVIRTDNEGSIWFIRSGTSSSVLDVHLSMGNCTLEPGCALADRGCDNICFSNMVLDECGRCKPPSAAGHLDLCNVCVGGDTNAQVNDCIECCAEPLGAAKPNCTTAGYIHDGHCIPDPCNKLRGNHTLSDMLTCLRLEPFNRKIADETLRGRIVDMSMSTCLVEYITGHPDNPFQPGGFFPIQEYEAMFTRNYSRHLDFLHDIQQVTYGIADDHYGDFISTGTQAYRIPAYLNIRYEPTGNILHDQRFYLNTLYDDCAMCVAVPEVRARYDPFFRSANPTLASNASIAEYHGWEVVAFDGNANITEALMHNLKWETGTPALGAARLSAMFTAFDPIFSWGSQVQKVDPSLEAFNGYNISLLNRLTGHRVDNLFFPLANVQNGTSMIVTVAQMRKFYVSDFYRAFFNDTLVSMDDLEARISGYNAAGIRGLYSLYSDRARSMSIEDLPPVEYPRIEVEDPKRRMVPMYLDAASVDIDEFRNKLDFEPDFDLKYGLQQLRDGYITLDEFLAHSRYHTAMNTRSTGDLEIIAAANSETIGYYIDHTKKRVVITATNFQEIYTSVDYPRNVNTTIAACEFLNDHHDYKLVIDIAWNSGGLPEWGGYLISILDPTGSNSHNHLPGFNSSNYELVQRYYNRHDSQFQKWQSSTILSSVTVTGSPAYYRNGTRWLLPSYVIPGDSGSGGNVYSSIDFYGNGTRFNVTGDLHLVQDIVRQTHRPTPHITRTYRRGEITVLTSYYTFSAGALFMVNLDIWGVPNIVHVGAAMDRGETNPLIGDGLVGTSGVDPRSRAQSNMDSLYRSAVQNGIVLNETERYDVFPYMSPSRLTLPLHITMTARNGTYNFHHTKNRTRADCVIGASTPIGNQPYLPTLQMLLDELDAPGVANECGCADEFRDCAGVCFGARRCNGEACTSADGCASGHCACGVCTATPDVTQNPDGSCVGTCVKACGDCCVELDQVPREDLCGLMTGGCSGLPVNTCVRCNPDAGEDPADIANASVPGYYPDEWDQAGGHVCVPTPSDDTLCPDPNLPSTLSVFPANVSSIDVRQYRWNAGLAGVTRSLTAVTDGCMVGFPSGDYARGVAEIFTNASFPSFGLGTLDSPTLMYIGAVRMFFDTLIFTGSGDLPVQIAIRPVIQQSFDDGLPTRPDLSVVLASVNTSISAIAARAPDADGYHTFTFPTPAHIASSVYGFAVTLETLSYGNYYFSPVLSVSRNATQICLRATQSLAPKKHMVLAGHYSGPNDFFYLDPGPGWWGGRNSDLDIKIVKVPVPRAVFPANVSSIDVRQYRWRAGLAGVTRTLTGTTDGCMIGFPSGDYARGIVEIFTNASFPTFGLGTVDQPAFFYLTGVRVFFDTLIYVENSTDVRVDVVVRPVIAQSFEDGLPTRPDLNTRIATFNTTIRTILTTMTPDANGRYEFRFASPPLISSTLYGFAVGIETPSYGNFYYAPTLSVPLNATQICVRATQSLAPKKHMVLAGHYSGPNDFFYLDPGPGWWGGRNSDLDIELLTAPCDFVPGCARSELGCDERCFSTFRDENECGLCRDTTRADANNECWACATDDNRRGWCSSFDEECTLNCACEPDPCETAGRTHWTAAEALACWRTEPFTERTWREQIRWLRAQYSKATSPTTPFMKHRNSARGPFDLVGEHDQFLNRTYPTMFDATQDYLRMWSRMDDSHNSVMYIDAFDGTFTPGVITLLHNGPRDPESGATGQYLELESNPIGSPVQNPWVTAFRRANPTLGVDARPEDFYRMRVVSINGRLDVVDYLAELAPGCIDTIDAGALSWHTGLNYWPSFSIDPRCSYNFAEHAGGYALSFFNSTSQSVVGPVQFPLVGVINREQESVGEYRRYNVPQFWREQFPDVQSFRDLADKFDSLPDHGWFKHATGDRTPPMDRRRDIGGHKMHMPTLMSDRGSDIGAISARSIAPPPVFPEDIATMVESNGGTIIGLYRHDAYKFVVLRMSSIGQDGWNIAERQANSLTVVTALNYTRDNSNYRLILDYTRSGGGYPSISHYLFTGLDVNGDRAANYLAGFNASRSYPQGAAMAVVDTDFQRWEMNVLHQKHGVFPLSTSIMSGVNFVLEETRDRFGVDRNVSFALPDSGDPTSFYVDIDEDGDGRAIKAWGDYYTSGSLCFDDFVPLPSERRVWKRGEIIMLISPRTFSGGGQSIGFALQWGIPTVVATDVLKDGLNSTHPLVSHGSASTAGSVSPYSAVFDLAANFTWFDFNSLYHDARIRNISVPDPARYDVYPYVFADSMNIPYEVTFAMIDGSLRNTLYETPQRADCSLYGNTHVQMTDYDSFIDRIARELTFSETRDECGFYECLDEDRDCAGNCFHVYEIAPTCDNQCVLREMAPRVDRCGALTGGCSGIIVDECYVCNSDAGEDVNDLAAASVRGYYPCDHDDDLANDGTCSCTPVAPDIVTCPPGGRVDFRTWADSYTHRGTWYDENEVVVFDSSQNWAGAVYGLPNGRNVPGVSQSFDYRAVPNWNIDISSGFVFVSGARIGVSYLHYDGINDYDVTFSLRYSSDAPTANANVIDPLPISQSVANFTLKMSEITIDDHGYMNMSFASPVKMSVPVISAPLSTFHLVISIPNYGFRPEVFPLDQFTSSLTQIWFSTANAQSDPISYESQYNLLFANTEVGDRTNNFWANRNEPAESSLMDVILELAPCEFESPCDVADRGCDDKCFSPNRVDVCGRCRPPSSQAMLDLCDVCAGGDTGVGINECIECCRTPLGVPFADCDVPGLLRDDQCVVDPCFGIPVNHTAEQMLPCLRVEPFNQKVADEGLRWMYAQMSLPTSPSIIPLQNVDNPHVPGGYYAADVARSLIGTPFPSWFDFQMRINALMRDLRDGHMNWNMGGPSPTYLIPTLFRSIDTHAGDAQTDQYLVLDRPVSCRRPSDVDCVASNALFDAYAPHFTVANPTLSASARIDDFLGWRVVEVNGRTDVIEYLTELAKLFNRDLSDSAAASLVFTQGRGTNSRFIRGDDPIFDVRASGYLLSLQNPANSEIISNVHLPFIYSGTTIASSHAAMRPTYVSEFYKQRFPWLATLDDLESLLNDFNANGSIGWYDYADDAGFDDAGRRRSAHHDVGDLGVQPRLHIEPVTTDHLDMAAFANLAPARYAEVLRSIGVHMAHGVASSGFTASDWETGRASLSAFKALAASARTESTLEIRELDSTFYAVVEGTATNIGYYRSDEHRWVVLRVLSFGEDSLRADAMLRSSQTIVDAAIFLTENTDYRLMIDVSENTGGLMNIGSYMLDVFDPHGTRRANYLDGFKWYGQAMPSMVIQAFVENDYHRWAMRTIDAQFGDFELFNSTVYTPNNGAQLWAQEYVQAPNGSHPTVSYKPPGEGGNTEFYIDIDVRGDGNPIKAWGYYSNIGIDLDAAFVVPPPNRRAYKKGEIVMMVSGRTFSAASHFVSYADLADFVTLVHMGGLKSSPERHPLISSGLGGSATGQGPVGSAVRDVYGITPQWDFNILYNVSKSLGVAVPEPATYNVFPWVWADRIGLSYEVLPGMKDGRAAMVGTADHPRADCVLFGNADFGRDDYLVHLQGYANEFEVDEVIEYCQLPRVDLCGILVGGSTGRPINDCVQCNPDVGEDPTDVAHASVRGYYPCDGCQCTAIPDPVTTCDVEAPIVDVTVWPIDTSDIDIRPLVWYTQAPVNGDLGNSVTHSSILPSQPDSDIPTSTVPPNDGGALTGFPNWENSDALATVFSDENMPNAGLGTLADPKVLRVRGVRVGIDRIIYNGTDIPLEIHIAPMGVPRTDNLFDVALAPLLDMSIAEIHTSIGAVREMDPDSDGRYSFEFAAPVDVLFDGDGVAIVFLIDSYAAFASTDAISFNYTWTQIWFTFRETDLPGSKLQRSTFSAGRTWTTTAGNWGGSSGDLDVHLIAQSCDYNRGCQGDELACDRRCFSEASEDLCGVCTTPNSNDRNACVECLADSGVAGIYPCGNANDCSCVPDPCALPRVGLFAQTYECFRRMPYNRRVHEMQAAHFISSMDGMAAEPMLKNASFSPSTRFQGVDVRALVNESLGRQFEKDYQTHAEFNRIVFATAQCHNNYYPPNCYRYNLWGLPIHFTLRIDGTRQYLVLDHALSSTLSSLFALSEYRSFTGIPFNPELYMGWEVVVLDGNTDPIDQITHMAYNSGVQDTPSTMTSTSIAAGQYTTRSGARNLPTIDVSPNATLISMRVRSPDGGAEIDLEWPMVATTLSSPVDESRQDPTSTSDFARRCVSPFYRNYNLNSYGNVDAFIEENFMETMYDFDRIGRCVSASDSADALGDGGIDYNPHIKMQFEADPQFADVFFSECVAMHPEHWNTFKKTRATHLEARSSDYPCEILYTMNNSIVSYWYCSTFNVAIIRVDSWLWELVESDRDFLIDVSNHLHAHDPYIILDQNGNGGGRVNTAARFLGLIDSIGRRNVLYGPSEYIPSNGIVDYGFSSLIRINAYENATGNDALQHSRYYNADVGFINRTSPLEAPTETITFSATHEQTRFYHEVLAAELSGNITARMQQFMENTPNIWNYTFDFVTDPARVFLVTSGFAFSASGWISTQFTAGGLGTTVGLYQPIDEAPMHCSRCRLSFSSASRMPEYSNQLCRGNDLPVANRQLMPAAGDTGFSQGFLYHPYGRSFEETPGLSGEQEYAYIPTDCSVFAGVPSYQSADRARYINLMVANLFNPAVSNCQCPPGGLERGLCSTRSAEGSPCSSDYQCNSGYCTDGVCCSSDCTGECLACNIAGHVGYCTEDRVCSGAPLGTPCASPSECLSGRCVDSVCCESACTGRCRSCTAAGMCEPDPTEDECTLTGDPCATDAQCRTGFCVDAVCCGSACDDECERCDTGNGVCRADVMAPGCAPLGRECSEDAQCRSRQCVDGVCCSQRCAGECERCDPEGYCGADDAEHGCFPNGAACVSSGQCLSGDCADDVCCATACDGECETCGAGGVCAPNTTSDGCVPDGGACDGEERCASHHCVGGVCCASACDGFCETCAGGACAPDTTSDGCVPDGAACDTEEQCRSAHCADGVCCASACDGECERCDLSDHAGECRAEADDVWCDDAVFCNGADYCVAGACGGHLGEQRCPEGQVCDHGADECVDAPAEDDSERSGWSTGAIVAVAVVLGLSALVIVLMCCWLCRGRGAARTKTGPTQGRFAGRDQEVPLLGGARRFRV